MRAKLLPSADPVIRRFSALAPLTDDAFEALRRTARAQRVVAARREIYADGGRIAEPLIILAGWAYRSHILADGRRQILSFALPGDLIGFHHHANPAAASSVIALTELVLCPLPDSLAGGIAEAFAVSNALDGVHHLRHITRLGRMSAQERIADWLLETRDRLLLSGSTLGNSFPLPVTQEFMADTLGLTSVHVNRTLQSMRREGLISLRSGMIILHDPERLASAIDYRPARVMVA